MKYKREHTYGIQMYEEQLYKEVVYDTRVDATEVEEYRFMNPLKKARPGGGQFRNLTEAQQHAHDIISAPIHARKKTPFMHMHSDLNPRGKTKMFDPYGYFRDNLAKEEEIAFQAKESTFFQMMLLKSDLLTK